MVDWIVQIYIVADDFRLWYAEIGPPVSRPFCLTQVLARKMRTRSIVSAPLSCLFCVRSLDQNLLQNFILNSISLWPQLMRQGQFCFAAEHGYGCSFVLAENIALAADSYTSKDDRKGEERNCRKSYGTVSPHLYGIETCQQVQ